VIECDVATLPAAPGAYVLELHVPTSVDVTVGCLGAVSLGPGRFRYYGSARGPGGLRARVLRHLESAGRRSHWHIDELTSTVSVARVWIDLDGCECELVSRDLASGNWDVAVEGFGSSDCRRCRAHLLVFRG
jgi:Uri superfamily endonuclease